MVVAITGASGAIYGIRLLERLREVHVETHLILSRWAKVTIEQETGYAASRVKRLADVNYSEGEQAAAISSGSYLTLGMVIAPCSTKTLAAIATGFAHNLICRAADVSLKERRRLVLVVREAPLSTIHLRNMVTVSELGATVFPPSPSFYDRPKGIDELVEYTVIRILDQFGINLQLDRRWEGIASSRTIAAEGEDDE
ncbi:MAG TPA: UbiX family flavin prenyltransferase [Candidatus Dormibacteraeota bacterium]|nr:UbiX family flavin prenyltransferase [Candidatus Dormibacteraeota bacterium]